MTEKNYRVLIAAAVAALDRNGAVVYPTETVYGLGVDAGSAAACELLFELKGGRRGTGIALLVADLAMAAPFVCGRLPAEATALAEVFWPGPLTMIVPAAVTVARDLLGPEGGVGLRCSSDAIAADLIRRIGRPVTATSANPSGRTPAASADIARQYFGDRVDCYLDGGERRGEAVSTVVEFVRGKTYLRRSGAIDRDAVAAIVPLEH